MEGDRLGTSTARGGGSWSRRRAGNLDRLNFLLTQKCVLSCSQCTGLGLVSLYITLYTRLVFFILSHSFSRYVLYSNSAMTIIALLKKFHAFISTHKNVEELLILHRKGKILFLS